jgi:hypothetical protein
VRSLYDASCHHLNGLNAEQAAAKMVLKSVIVENRQLVVMLGIGP